jgi:hypothetical protein
MDIFDFVIVNSMPTYHRQALVNFVGAALRADSSIRRERLHLHELFVQAGLPGGDVPLEPRLVVAVRTFLMLRTIDQTSLFAFNYAVSEIQDILVGLGGMSNAGSGDSSGDGGSSPSKPSPDRLNRASD